MRDRRSRRRWVRTARPTSKDALSDMTTETPARHDAYAALRRPDFVLFLIAGLLATIGAEMQSVAVGWELYERTRDPLALGWVGFVQAIPVIGLALPAGHVADRHSRKAIIITTQALMGVASLGLALLSYGRGSIAGMYGFLFLTGLAGAFSFPARWALLPALVPTDEFHNAVTWRSSSWQVAAMIGPALGGIGLAVSHSATPVYLCDAVISLVVVACLCSVRPRPRVIAKTPLTWDSLLAGARFVRRSELILATITLDMFAVLLGGATTLLPIYAKDILAEGPTGLGILRAAPSVGAFVTAVVLAHRRPFRRAGRTLLWAVAGFGAATIVFGLSRSFWLSLAMLTLTGAFDNVSVVIRGTLVQLLTPDVMRGRVSAINSIFIGVSNELGGFESGVAARLIGQIGRAHV